MSKFLIIHPDEISEKWISRLCGLGVNTLGIHSVGGTNAHVYLQNMLEDLKSDDIKALLDKAKKNGLDIEYELHAASFLLPRELFPEHPEYFREDVEGKRTPEFNFCVSEPEALKIVSHRAAELAETLYLSSDKFYFWLDDGKNLHCHCPKCREFSSSDQQLIVLNAIIEEIKTVRPDAKLAYLAYCTTIGVPKKIKPHKDIFLEYAPFERDRSKPASTMNKAEKENITALFELFGKKNSKILEYWYDNSMFSGWKKPPKYLSVDNAMMLDDIAFYRELGFENVGSFACYIGADYEELFGEPDLDSFKNV